MKPHPTRLKKTLIYGGGALLVVLSAAGSYWLTVEMHGRAAVEGLKADGFSVTLAELAPPEVLDQENAAILYQEAFDLLEADRDYLGTDPSSCFDALVALDGPANYQAYLTEASTEWKDSMKRFLARHATDMDLLVRAKDLSSCRFDIPYSDPMLAFVKNGGNALAFGHLLRWELWIALEAGDVDRLMNWLMTSRSLARRWESIDCALSHLVCGVLDGTFMALFREAVKEQFLPDDFLRQIHAELDPGLYPQLLARSLQFELIEHLSYLDQALGGEEYFVADPADWMVDSWLGHWLIRRDRIHIAEEFRKRLALANRPYHLTQKEFAALGREADTWGPTSYPVLRRWGFSGRSAFQIFARNKMSRRLARKAIELELRRREDGRLPTKLDPPLLDELTGRLFIYDSQRGTLSTPGWKQFDSDLSDFSWKFRTKEN